MDFGIVIGLLEYAIVAIQAIGIIIILYAAAQTAASLVRIEFSTKKLFFEYEHRKRLLIQKIILALDFFVAADLIQLVILSNMTEITSLALIVAVRIALNWSLSKEINLHKEYERRM